MSNVKIGAKAIHVLKSIKAISPKVKIREDYLYTSLSPEDDMGKGIRDISVVYTLPTGEIETPEEIGIYDSGSFLSVLGSFDSPKIGKEGNILTVADGRKSLKYHTAPTNNLPERKTKGEEIYEAGKTVLSFGLTPEDLDALLKDISLLDFNEINVKGNGSQIHFNCRNSVTDDTINIKIPDELVGACEDVEYILPSVEVLAALMKGTYKVDIRQCTLEGRPKPLTIGRFSNVEVDSGALVYSIVGK